MKALVAAAFALFFGQHSYAQVLEKSVDFTVSAATISDGTVQYALEWMTPSEFRKTNLLIADVPQVNELHPTTNQIVASKVAFIAKKSFDSLSYQKMNKPDYISEMLNSVAISQKNAPDFWLVTNKVVAYKIPFKVSFDFKFREVKANALDANLMKYLKDESSAIKSDGRERILLLDMTNFSELMYQNYSVVYMKEINANETLIVSGIIAGLDLKKANRYFQYPPLSTSKGVVIKNLKTQILQMVKIIQKD